MIPGENHSALPLLEDFLQYLRTERKYSLHTQLAYGTDLRLFGQFLFEAYGLRILASGADLQQLKHTHARAWLAEQPLQATTTNRKLASLRAFIRFQMRAGNLARNPLLVLKQPKTPKRLPIVAPKDALNSAMDVLADLAPRTTDFAATRDRAILELLYGCGIRRSELIELRPWDIHAAQYQLKVMGKGRKERIVPFGAHVRSVLIEYEQAALTAGFDGRQWFFVTDKGEQLYPKLVYNVARAFLGQFPELARHSPHVLRHTFATHLVDAGADLKAVQELLGHASLSSTQVYVHSSAERLRRVYDQAHPKSGQ
jgi:integrase/recombinase XerC